MACARCGADVETRPRRWCPSCELAYDAWVRRHATDIIWVVMSGGVVLAVFGMILPMLGAAWLVGVSAAFLGWGTLLGAARLNSRRRRRQFLSGVALPRAYLPAPKS